MRNDDPGCCLSASKELANRALHHYRVSAAGTRRVSAAVKKATKKDKLFTVEIHFWESKAPVAEKPVPYSVHDLHEYPNGPLPIACPASRGLTELG